MILTRDYLFVHVAKAAGTSMQRALARRYAVMQYVTSPMLYARLMRSERIPRNPEGRRHLDHLSYLAVREVLGPDEVDRRFKWCFVRNPWAREVSLYHHTLRGPHHRHHAEVVGKSFPEYVRWMVGARARRSQTELIVDEQGRLAMDWIGRFERLVEDFAQVCERIGAAGVTLPERNMGGYDRSAWKRAYDDATRDLVGAYYARDVDLLGYEFDDG